MITYHTTIVKPGQYIDVVAHTGFHPYPRFQTFVGIPKPESLNFLSKACFVTGTVVVLGGAAAITVTAASHLPVGAKVGICLSVGAVMLGSYFCCKLASAYRLTSESFHRINASFDDGMDDW